MSNLSKHIARSIKKYFAVNKKLPDPTGIEEILLSYETSKQGKIDKMEEAFSHYFAEYPGAKKTIELLEKALEKDQYQMVEKVHNSITIWEPLEGRYTVADFCEMIRL